MKIKLKENNKLPKLDYFKVQKALKELLNEETKGMLGKKKDKTPGKVKFPMDYILFKFPDVKKVLTELLTVTFKNYIDNIYIIAPKPSTLKVVLKNEQHFFIIYNERSYIVKVEGKKYYLLNLGERERATQAIADLLGKKKFVTSKTEEEMDAEASESADKGGSGGGGGGDFPGGDGGSAPKQDEDLPDLGDLDKIDDDEPPPGTAAADEEGKGKSGDLKEIRISFKKKSLNESFIFEIDENTETISRSEAVQKILNSKGAFFNVQFIKKDGTLRVMTCRLGVKKYLKGGSLRYDVVEKGLIPVFDTQVNEYRMINKNTITALNIGGKTYKIEEEISEIKTGPQKFEQKYFSQERFHKLLKDIRTVLGERIKGKFKYGSIYNDAISFHFDIDNITNEEKEKVKQLINRFDNEHNIRKSNGVVSINFYPEDVRIGLYLGKVSPSGGGIGEIKVSGLDEIKTSGEYYVSREFMNSYTQRVKNEGNKFFLKNGKYVIISKIYSANLDKDNKIDQDIIVDKVGRLIAKVGFVIDKPIQDTYIVSRKEGGRECILDSNQNFKSIGCSEGGPVPILEDRYVILYDTDNKRGSGRIFDVETQKVIDNFDRFMYRKSYFISKNNKVYQIEFNGDKIDVVGEYEKYSDYSFDSFNGDEEDAYHILHDNGYTVRIQKGKEKIKIKGEYSDIYPLKDGNFQVRNNNKSGIVNKDGSIIIPINYSLVSKKNNHWVGEKDKTTDIFNENGKLVKQFNDPIPNPTQLRNFNKISKIKETFGEWLEILLSPFDISQTLAYSKDPEKTAEILGPKILNNLDEPSIKDCLKRAPSSKAKGGVSSGYGVPNSSGQKERILKIFKKYLSPEKQAILDNLYKKYNIDEVKVTGDKFIYLKNLYKTLKNKFPNLNIKFDDGGDKVISTYEPYIFIKATDKPRKYININQDKNGTFYYEGINGQGGNFSLQQIVDKIKNDLSINELWTQGDRQEVSNISYYEQLLAQSPVSQKTRDLIRSIISNIRQRGNLATPKQLVVLQKLKQGSLREIKTISNSQHAIDRISEILLEADMSFDWELFDSDGDRKCQIALSTLIGDEELEEVKKLAKNIPFKNGKWVVEENEYGSLTLIKNPKNSDGYSVINEWNDLE